MILEADEETRDFVTIYNKDYPPKRCKKLSKFIQPLNYNPPLNVFNGPFKEYLNSLRENERVSAEEKTEDIRDNLKRVRLKYKHLDKFIPDTPPNEDVIESEKKKAYKTIYQLEYSQHLGKTLNLKIRLDELVEFYFGGNIFRDSSKIPLDFPRFEILRFQRYLKKKKITGRFRKISTSEKSSHFCH